MLLLPVVFVVAGVAGCLFELARTPRTKQQLQVDRLTKFKQKNAAKAEKALDKLADVVERGENCFPMCPKR